MTVITGTLVYHTGWPIHHPGVALGLVERIWPVESPGLPLSFSRLPGGSGVRWLTGFHYTLRGGVLGSGCLPLLGTFDHPLMDMRLVDMFTAGSDVPLRSTTERRSISRESSV